AASYHDAQVARTGTTGSTTVAAHRGRDHHSPAHPTVPPSSSDAAIAAQGRAAVTAGRALITVDVQGQTGDVSASAEHKSVAAIAAKRVAAISRPASAAVTAVAARSARRVAASAASCESLTHDAAAAAIAASP